MRFSRIEDLEAALPTEDFGRAQLPWEAAFLAGKAFVQYRRSGGTKTSTLPGFSIGAHAAIADVTLLTSDGLLWAPGSRRALGRWHSGGMAVAWRVVDTTNIQVRLPSRVTIPSSVTTYVMSRRQQSGHDARTRRDPRLEPRGHPE